MLPGYLEVLTVASLTLRLKQPNDGSRHGHENDRRCCERLGFQLDFQGPDGGPFWAGVSRDGIGIMLKAVASDVLPIPNHTRHEWGPSDADIYSMDPDALFDEFRRRGASFVQKLSFIEEGLWGFTVTDADGYVVRFFCLRDK